MKLKFAKLCVWIACKLDPSLKIFADAVHLERERARAILAAKWRSIDWTKALRYVNIEGGNPDCEHANVTSIKKWRTQDWTRDCTDCGAKLFLYCMDGYTSIKNPDKNSRQYKIATALYAQELSQNPEQEAIAFEDLDRPQREHFFKMSNELLYAD